MNHKTKLKLIHAISSAVRGLAYSVSGYLIIKLKYAGPNPLDSQMGVEILGGMCMWLATYAVGVIEQHFRVEKAAEKIDTALQMPEGSTYGALQAVIKDKSPDSDDLKTGDV